MQHNQKSKGNANGNTHTLLEFKLGNKIISINQTTTVFNN